MCGGPTRSWLKAKVRREGRFVIAGVAKCIEGWSLLAGEVEERYPRYRGLMHFGVGARLSKELTSDGLVRRTSPFAEGEPVRSAIRLELGLTAGISYAEILPGGSLQVGVFRDFAAMSNSSAVQIEG